MVVKVECCNPIRSFKGRGTDYLMPRLGESPGRS
jgi:threonine dehydratase